MLSFLIKGTFKNKVKRREIDQLNVFSKNKLTFFTVYLKGIFPIVHFRTRL